MPTTVDRASMPPLSVVAALHGMGKTDPEFQTQVLALQKNPMRHALALKSLHQVIHLTLDLSTEEIHSLAHKPDLLGALHDLATARRASDPLAAARLRTLRIQKEMLAAEGGDLGVEEVAALLAISRQAVTQRRARAQLLGVTLGTRVYRYPAWQFGEGGVLQGLPETLAALAPATAWDAMRFFLTKSPALRGQRPLDLLRKGRTQKVLAAARAFDQQGA